jgi:hypothetical protein
MVVGQEAHEAASALVGPDASLEIGLAGRRRDLARDDVAALDTTEFGFEGRDDGLEGTLANMLAVLNGKAIDHVCLLFVCRIVAAVDVDRFDLYHPALAASYHMNV